MLANCSVSIEFPYGTLSGGFDDGCGIPHLMTIATRGLKKDICDVSLVRDRDVLKLGTSIIIDSKIVVAIVEIHGIRTDGSLILVTRPTMTWCDPSVSDMIHEGGWVLGDEPEPVPSVVAEAKEPPRNPLARFLDWVTA